MSIETISKSSSFQDSLAVMSMYKTWTESTIMSYKKDVENFEEYLIKLDIEPIISNGKLHVIQKWVKDLKEAGVAFTTIKRRLASLSSIVEFYRNLGLLDQNCFKIVEAPIGDQSQPSTILDLVQMQQVYQYSESLLNEQEKYIVPTIRMLIFSGLRNEVLTNLHVSQIDFDKSLLYIKYENMSINSKHRTQVIPLPPKFIELLKTHVKEYELQPHDKLLFGLSGLPLADKALNRLTNRINRELGWTDNERITPHGFRATISTILSERGVDISAIKFLLGHSERDNIQYYIRRYQRHINQLKKSLTQIEDELIQGTTNGHVLKNIDIEDKSLIGKDRGLDLISKDVLLKLIQADPEIAVILIQRGLRHM